MHALKLLYEHDDFIIVNKPAGIGMHYPEITVQNRALEQFNIQTKLVHRLDTQTSGCMILAKNKEGASAFTQLFETHHIDKYYIALSSRTPKKKQGRVVGKMLSARNGNYMLSKSERPDTATLFFSSSYSSNEKTSLRLFYCKPISGKTHQIRVALKSLGSPILGDQRYKGEGADRMYLHCHALHFVYKNTNFCFSCIPEPSDYFSQDELYNIKSGSDYKWPSFTLPNKYNNETNN